MSTILHRGGGSTGALGQKTSSSVLIMHALWYCRGGSGNLKGGFFLLLWLAPPKLLVQC